MHKSYGKLKVLNGIDMEVNNGEVVCLIGASGSGKSTLLLCVNALEIIDNGKYGICSECEEPIPEARLKVIPFAAHCIECLDA